jgi:ABC-2 type transport system permease protein
VDKEPREHQDLAGETEEHLSRCQSVTLPSCHLVTLSPCHPFRAWLYLVWLSVQRLAHVRLLVGIALGLLAFLTFLVVLNTRAGRWSTWYWHWPSRGGPNYAEWLHALASARLAAPLDAAGMAGPEAVSGAFDAVLTASGFYVFSHWFIFPIFATFLLPLLSLTFATESLGRERESGNLIWLLTRPLPRPAIYLAKYVAILPWALGLCLGGLGVLCLAAGPPGRVAFRLYWPAVFWSTLAYCALFHLLAAWLRRAAVVAILYSFFLETLMGNMPGYLKRLSISFYTRCYMFHEGRDFGIRPDRPLTFVPVGGTTALCVLAGATILLLATGMVLFARREYLDLG